MKERFDVHYAEGIPMTDGAALHALTEMVYDPSASLSALADRFDADADIVVEFLTTVLPQGTVDRVIAKLLTKKASHFIIPMEKAE